MASDDFIPGDFDSLVIFNPEQLGTESCACDGSWEGQARLCVNVPILLNGLGFLRPKGSEAGTYEAKIKLLGLFHGTWVEFQHLQGTSACNSNQSHFYIVFEHPMEIKPMPKPVDGEGEFNLEIRYRLRGPPAQSLNIPFDSQGNYKFYVNTENVQFECCWRHRQLNEILYTVKEWK